MIKNEGLSNKPQDIAERVFIFATRVLRMTTQLPRNSINIVLINQIIRSVTSIGANIEEARGGHTKTDFTYWHEYCQKRSARNNLLVEINY